MFSENIATDLMCNKYSKEGVKNKQITVSSYPLPLVLIEVKVETSETFIRYREQINNQKQERTLEVVLNNHILLNKKFMEDIIDEINQIKEDHSSKIKLDVPGGSKRYFKGLSL